MSSARGVDGKVMRENVIEIVFEVFAGFRHRGQAQRSGVLITVLERLNVSIGHQQISPIEQHRRQRQQHQQGDCSRKPTASGRGAAHDGPVNIINSDSKGQGRVALPTPR